MAETPSQQPPSPPPEAQSAHISDSDRVEYWCYQCNKRVSVETLADHPQIICSECNSGFVESIAPAPLSRTSDQVDYPSLGNQFIQVLHLIAQAARDDDAPPPPPSEHEDPLDNNDYLRIELNGWDDDEEDEDDDDDDDDDEEEEEEEEEEENEEENEEDEQNQENQYNDGTAENENSEERGNEEVRRARRDVLRLRLRDFATRGTNRRNRDLDWSDILLALEDHSIEFRLQGADGYVGNPGDYVDAAGYEAVLQNLAENDGGGRRGAPPAAESAVAVLKTVEIKLEKEVLHCAVCKDLVNVGEVAKELPCGHGYHGDCIVPWLGSRNTCPVCRFELPTDDPDYEEKRKKKLVAHYSGSGAGTGTGTGAGAGSSRSGNYFPGLE